MATQKVLSKKMLIIVIAAIMAVMPLSLDLYLPALPQMVDYFHTSAKLANLTLILFMVIFSLSMLFWGPMSDKYGRKPILMAGLIIFSIFSVACAMAVSIEQMIIARFFQGLGAGAVVAVVPAIIKDSYAFEEREQALAWVQTIVITAPVVGPTIGAFLMKLTSWQGVFWLLAGFSLIGLLLVQLISETNLSRFEGTILKSISRVGFVLRNKAFTRLLAIFSLVMMPSLAFVAASSYIFIDHFGLDEAGYGLYYMVDAAFRVIGPFAYLFMVRYFARHLIIRYGFLAIGITGLFIVAFGPIHPWGFTLAVLPLMLVGSMVRTPGTNLMLEQVDKDTGTASSLINSIGSVCGALGMMVISFDMGSKILVLAFMTLIVGVVLTVSWWNIKPAYFQRATGG